ncbi:MAG: energy-coupling factor transporter transmembrane protein EcfT [Clostridia bacterium]|nr:energy-coupling factor transporter transmembrane protein EcfT [Clostridia bacterium]
MREVTFGQYYPVSSFVHKMDARIKILLTIAYIVAVFLVKEFYFLGYAIATLFLLLACIFARVPIIKILKSIKAILFFVIFSSVLQIFFNESGNTILEWEFIKITDIGLYKAGFITLRIVLIVMGTSLLTLTTTPVELADGIESLLSPLKLIKFPAHEFALIMSIALRYIPTLMDETDRIIKAQKARGADFESGNIFKRAKALIPILIPLLIGSFRRADELADAMEARCYTGAKGRTKYKKQRITYRDILGLLAVALVLFGICATNGWVNPNWLIVLPI